MCDVPQINPDNNGKKGNFKQKKSHPFGWLFNVQPIKRFEDALIIALDSLLGIEYHHHSPF